MCLSGGTGCEYRSGPETNARGILVRLVKKIGGFFWDKFIDY